MAALFDLWQLPEDNFEPQILDSVFNESNSTEGTTAQPSGLPWSCKAPGSPNATTLLMLLKVAGPSYIGPMTVVPILAFIMFVLYIDLMIFFKRDGCHWKRRAFYAWILGSFPVAGVLNTMAIFMPATSWVVGISNKYYFAVAMKKFCELVINYYGGKRGMVHALAHEHCVSHNPFPCCFVVCFCRNKPMSMARVNQLHGVAHQVIFAFPIIYFCQTLMIAEGLSRITYGKLLIGFFGYLGGLSSFMAVYSFVIFCKSSRESLQGFGIRGKYVCLQLVVGVNTIQNFVLGVMQRADALPCGFPYPDKQQAYLMHAYIMTIWLFVLCVGSWFAFRKSEQGVEVMVLPEKKSNPDIAIIITVDTKNNDDIHNKYAGSYKNSLSSGIDSDCFYDNKATTVEGEFEDDKL